MLSWGEIELRAVRFSKCWKNAHYEKGETQSFYNDFFEVFGVSRRRVARYEELVKLQPKKSGYVDLLWPKVLIVEQKSLGGDLKKAVCQVDEYFDAIPDNEKPRFRLVCDFQRFSLLDRDTREVAEFSLAELHKNIRRFAFMLGLHAPKIRPQEHLNREAADYIASIHKALTVSGYPEKHLPRLLTRLVFCLFADNTGIFQPRGIFVDILEAQSKEDGSDLGQLLSHLFQVLDTPAEDRQKGLDAGLAAFPYVDGGLFKERLTIPSMDSQGRRDLFRACAFDWSEVSPAIFSSLFQSVLSHDERRATGSFATAEHNIMKVINGLCFDALRDEFDNILAMSAMRIEALTRYRAKLRRLTFLDPACGCGNFLVIAYRELRQLELEVLLELHKLGALKKSTDRHPVVNVDQFYGIEVRPYSARIAEVALWMTDHIANSALSLQLDVEYHRVPLSATPTLVIGDALSLKWHDIIPPANCSYILGNPPYKGAKGKQNIKERQQIRRLAKLPGSGGTLDYACGWVLKSAEYASAGSRVALVTVNSLVQGEQAAQLWPLLYERYSLEIAFAHQPFHWNSEARGRAQVQVVILGLVQRESAPIIKRLYSYQSRQNESHIINCNSISPYLLPCDDVYDPHTVVREVPRPINGLRKLRTGTKPIDGGYYILTEEERVALLKEEPDAYKYIREFIGGDEFLKGSTRYILVLAEATKKDLLNLPKVRKLISLVGAYRRAEIASKDGKRRLKSPSDGALLDDPRRFHITALPSTPFLVIPEVTSERRKYVPIGWLNPPVVPSNLVKYLENSTLFEFGLLTSAMHMAWLRTIGGRLEGRLRYSIGVVYNTFPIAIGFDEESISKMAGHILDARKAANDKGLSLSDMYDPELMPPALRKAHRLLDEDVDRHYMGKVADNDEERVIHLLKRYHTYHSPPQ